MQNTTDIERLIETMIQLGKLVKQEFFTSQDENCPTLLQILALRYLKNGNQTTVGDLAVHLQLSKSSATQLVERLVEAQLVERVNDETDRRIIRLMLTSKGRQEIEKLKDKRTEKMKKILSKVPENDVRELIRIHAQLIETLKSEQQSTHV